MAATSMVWHEAALTGSEAVANPEAPVAEGTAAPKAKKVTAAKKVKAKAKAEKKAAKPRRPNRR